MGPRGILLSIAGAVSTNKSFYPCPLFGQGGGGGPVCYLIPPSPPLFLETSFGQIVGEGGGGSIALLPGSEETLSPFRPKKFPKFGEKIALSILG